MAESAGLVLDEWQRLVIRNSLGVRADGKWAAFSSCLIVPRQNGKGAILEALALAGLFLFGCELIVWTAHEMKTAKEGFRRLVSLITNTPDLYRDVAAIKRGNDDRGIELVDGRRIQFLARSSGSGRGFTGDLILLDEAYKLDGDVMAALLPTLSAVPNPQIWYTSSAPMEDSEQLHSVRARGVKGDDPGLAFHEWSIDPATDDPTAAESWAKANPAYPHRISHAAIEAEWREFNADVDPGKFARERLGVPDDPPSAEEGPINFERWRQLERHELAEPASIRLALDAPWGHRSATFGLAGRLKNGRPHVQVRRHVPESEMGNLVWLAKALVDEYDCPLIIAGDSPAQAWKSLLEEQGVKVDELSSKECREAFALMTALVGEGTVSQRSTPELDAAVAGLAVRKSGDGELWARRLAQVNIAPFVAVTCALLRVAEPPEVVHAPFVVVA